MNRSLLKIVFHLCCGVVLCCGQLIWSPSVLSDTNQKTSYKGSVFYYTHTTEHQPVKIDKGSVAAARFQVELPFSQVGINCPSYGDNIGALSLTLFVWDTDYATTIKGRRLASKRFVNFKDNETLQFKFKTLPAGDYLLTIGQSEQNVGIWKTATVQAGLQSFLNGSPISGAYELSVWFESLFPFSGSWSQYRELQKMKSTCPKEPKLPDDSDINRWDPQPDTWGGIDGLNRVLPEQKEVGPTRPKKQVGIFYWTWHQHKGPAAKNPFDNTKIIKEHPDAPGNIDHPAWGPMYVAHHWGEPLFGYYSTEDKWVIRKHAELLAAAQVDVVIFDATNGSLTWMDSLRTLMQAFSEARADGVRTPKFAFMLPFWDLKYTKASLVQLYRDVYRDGVHKDLWYYWQDKPLIYALPEALELDKAKLTSQEQKELQEIRRFFTFRPGQPAYKGGPRRPDNWSWLEIYPQNGYVPRNDGSFEMVCVGVAQNHSAKSFDGRIDDIAAMNDRNVFGRAYVAGAPKDTRENAFIYGGNFQQQWSRAFELDPDFVFVTGWNEWSASRFPKMWGLPNAFPDQYNEEFSRDTEPSRGTLKDHFYLQLVSNIRKFKGVRSLPPVSPKQTMTMNGGNNGSQGTDKNSDEWKSVTPVYRDWKGDTAHRDGPGYGELRYKNDTGRNDIILAKVARDDENLYFMVETNKNLSAKSDSGWMRFYLVDYDRKDLPNWESFQFIVNRTNPGEKAVLERNTGGWNWEKVDEIDYQLTEKRLVLKIPRKLLGLSGNKSLNLGFKWSDNIQKDGDILDFYDKGDSAPDGRFTWRYKAEN